MAAGKSRMGIDIAIAIGAIVVVGCAVWFGYYLGRYSVAAELKEAVDGAVSAMQSDMDTAAPAPTAQAEEAGQQAFETETARVTYRETVEPTTGNAMVSFTLENKTDATVLVSGENVIVNGEYGVGTLGGSAAPIAPWATGSVSVVFGYSAQTPLRDIGEIETVACDLVMRDNDSPSTVIGSAPVSIAI